MGILNFADSSTSTIPIYEYEPLRNTNIGVRFLKVFPGRLEDHVMCDLFEAELRERMCFELPQPWNPKAEPVRVKYEALSWSWGKTSAEYQIHVRKGRGNAKMRVSKDLVWALKHLRRPHEDRILWIDAICIDQSNTIERNHQVENMAIMYDQALNVCVWLGRDNQESKMAIDFIKNEIMEFQNFDDLCGRNENTNKWKALLSLMQRPWFSRRWVVVPIIFIFISCFVTRSREHGSHLESRFAFPQDNCSWNSSTLPGSPKYLAFQYTNKRIARNCAGAQSYHSLRRGYIRLEAFCYCC